MMNKNERLNYLKAKLKERFIEDFGKDIGEELSDSVNKFGDAMTIVVQETEKAAALFHRFVEENGRQVKGKQVNMMWHILYKQLVHIEGILNANDDMFLEKSEKVDPMLEKMRETLHLMREEMKGSSKEITFNSPQSDA